MIGRSKKFYRTIRRRLLTRSLVSSLRTKTDQKPHVLFVFPGMQGFWPGMGRGLFRTEPVFRETVLRCNQLIEKQFSPLSYFEGGDLNPISSFFAQMIIQIALAELWRSKGVEPQGTVGCSLGIITSCQTNESMSLENILRVAQLYAQTPPLLDCKYNLIFIQVGLDKLRSILESCPVEVFLSAELGPSENIAVCAEQDVQLVCSLLEEYGLTYSVTDTGNGGHSPETSARFQSPEWSKVISTPPKYEFFSSFGGTSYPSGVSFDANFWYWQIAKPCLSGTALSQALAAGYNTIVIVGSLALNHHIRELAATVSKNIVILDSIRNDEPEDWTFNCTLSDLKALNLVSPNHGGPTLSVVDSQLRYQNPYGYYESLKKSGSVHFLEEQGHWMILDYDDVSSALNEPQVFSSQSRNELDSILIGKDPPDHTIMRQALVPLFSARGLSKFDETIADCAQDILDELRSKDEFDIVFEFAIPFAQSVIGHVIGMSPQEVKDLQNALGKDRYLLKPNTVLESFFVDYITRSESKPKENFLHRLQSVSPVSLSTESLVSMLRMLWITGTTSSSMLLGNAAQILLNHHAVRHEIQYDMKLIPQFTEEVLRFESPEQVISRFTLADTIVGGVHIPAQSSIKLCIAAANRDAKHYHSPDLFILNRNPKDHLAFGAGSHYCLGAMLARMEAQIGIKKLLETFPKLQAKQSWQKARYEKSEQFRALVSLPVTIPIHQWSM